MNNKPGDMNSYTAHHRHHSDLNHASDDHTPRTAQSLNHAKAVYVEKAVLSAAALVVGAALVAETDNLIKRQPAIAHAVTAIQKPVHENNQQMASARNEAPSVKPDPAPTTPTAHVRARHTHTSLAAPSGPFTITNTPLHFKTTSARMPSPSFEPKFFA